VGEVEAHLTAATNWERKRTIERWIAVGISHIRSLAPSEGPRGSATTGGILQTFARWSRSRAGSKPVKNPDFLVFDRSLSTRKSIDFQED